MGEFEITHVFGSRAAAAVPDPVPGRPPAVPRRSRGTPSGSAGSTSIPTRTSRPSDWLHWTRNAPELERHVRRVPLHQPAEGLRPGQRDLQHDAGPTSTSAARPATGPARATSRGRACRRWRGPTLADLGLVVPTSGITSTAARRAVRALPLAPRRARRLRPHAAGCCSTTCCRRCSTEGLYFADGQQLDEVYTYALVPAEQDVRARRQLQRLPRQPQPEAAAAKATSCACSATSARSTTAPTTTSTRRQVEGKPSDGALCVKCHMPERPYMVVDWRADHSFRRPRPDLTRGDRHAQRVQPVRLPRRQAAAWSVERVPASGTARRGGRTTARRSPRRARGSPGRSAELRPDRRTTRCSRRSCAPPRSTLPAALPGAPSAAAAVRAALAAGRAAAPPRGRLGLADRRSRGSASRCSRRCCRIRSRRCGSTRCPRSPACRGSC